MVSKEELRKLDKEELVDLVYNLSISEGTVFNLLNKAANMVLPIYEGVKEEYGTPHLSGFFYHRRTYPACNPGPEVNPGLPDHETNQFYEGRATDRLRALEKPGKAGDLCLVRAYSDYNHRHTDVSDRRPSSWV